MKETRRNNIENYVVKNIYKELIIKKMKAGKDITIYRKRLEQLHGKKWEKIIKKIVKTPTT
jgi:hypothetical protein|tara:strand:- start:677 stop:859 length:183 start_codon:yes stop_codon:yes gene_type:complete